LLPLDQLFAVNRESPEYRTKEQSRLFYAESWALTHMLLTHDRYRSGAYRFLTIVRAALDYCQFIAGRLREPVDDHDERQLARGIGPAASRCE